MRRARGTAHPTEASTSLLEVPHLVGNYRSCAMGTSGRKERAEIVTLLRHEGRSWVDVARALSERYDVNARVAFRWAHGWSQSEVAAAWCERWPDDPKTFKNISYWERWPQSGHAPSLSTLDRLARIYECSIADLLEDLPGYRQSDPAAKAHERAGQLWRAVSGPPAPGDARRGVSAIDQVADMTVEELAQTAIGFTQQLGMEAADRRPILVKLSAALSLAATAPHPADLQRPDGSPGLARGSDLSGVWHSRYVYPSRGEMLEGQHYVVVRQQADRLVGHSLPHTNGSRLRLDLSLHPPVATGSWTEHTSPTGRYKGAAYHGSVQLMVDPSNRAMAGKWVGFGRRFAVKTGEWELTWVDRATTASALREYHRKV